MHFQETLHSSIHLFVFHVVDDGKFAIIEIVHSEYEWSINQAGETLIHQVVQTCADFIHATVVYEIPYSVIVKLNFPANSDESFSSGR